MIDDDITVIIADEPTIEVTIDDTPPRLPCNQAETDLSELIDHILKFG